MKRPVLIALVLLLTTTSYAFAHVLAKGIVLYGGVGVGAAVIIGLLLATPWLSRHLD